MITKFESYRGDDELDENDLESARERIANQFWIDRDGKEYHWQGSLEDAWDMISLHYEIVYELFPDVENPKDYVMNLGWILVGSTVYSCPIINKKPSQAQIDKLFDLGLYKRLCILQGRYYPKYDDVKDAFEKINNINMKNVKNYDSFINENNDEREEIMKTIKTFEQFLNENLNLSLTVDEYEKLMFCDYVIIAKTVFIKYEIAVKILEEYGKKITSNTLNMKYNSEATLSELEKIVRNGFDITDAFDSEEDIENALGLDVVVINDTKYVNENYFETLIQKFGEMKRQSAIKLN